MQSGMTNPMSDTFRIYNPNKNIEEKDLKVIMWHKECWIRAWQAFSHSLLGGN